jgi:transcriptional/translational regulatory protein YebC/TACO1
MRPLAIAAASALILVLSGCSAAQDTADKAAGAAKSAAAAEVQQQVQQQICELVQDEKLSADDKAQLSRLLEQAKQLKLPEDILEPAQQLVEKGSQAKSDLENLRARCGE